MVMRCNINTCHKCYFVYFVTNKSAQLTFGERNGDRSGQETLRRPALPAHSPAARPVADPDRRGAWDLAELRQFARAEPASGDGTDPAAAGRKLRPRSARPRHGR